MQTSQNVIYKPKIIKQETGLIAFFIYLAIFLAPNGKLFIIKLSDNAHLTPIRSVFLVIGILVTLNILNKKLNIVAIIRKFILILPLTLLLFIKIASLLYSFNYLGGIAVIEWFIEDICFAVICYVYYVKGVIVPSKIILFMFAGFVLSISMSFVQITNFAFNFNFLLPIVNYVNSNTQNVNLSYITGLYIGDRNSYATYIAAVLLTFSAILVYSNKYLLRTAILFILGTTVLYSTQSRSGAITFILVLIYIIFRDVVILSKKFILLLFIILMFLSIIIKLPSETSDVFFHNYSLRYVRFFNYITLVENEDTIEAHKEMVLKYFYHIDKEPIACIIGVGEGDYLELGGGEEKGETGAHNAYVLILGENGPIAFLLFAYITWLILKASIFINRYSSLPMAKSLLYFNIAYLLSFVLYGSQFHEYIFWGIIGITFAEKTRIVKNMNIIIGRSIA